MKSTREQELEYAVIRLSGVIVSMATREVRRRHRNKNLDVPISEALLPNEIKAFDETMALMRKG